MPSRWTGIRPRQGVVGRGELGLAFGLVLPRRDVHHGFLEFSQVRYCFVRCSSAMPSLRMAIVATDRSMDRSSRRIPFQLRSVAEAHGDARHYRFLMANPVIAAYKE